MKNIIIHWFRQDLRLSDNPSLSEAANLGLVMPVYILDDEDKIGLANKTWLHYSLKSLNETLGGNLSLHKGKTEEILLKLIKDYNPRALHYNRCYEPWQILLERKLKALLVKEDMTVRDYNCSLLWEPWDVLKADKSSYRVFTPFYRNACLKAKKPRVPIDAPQSLNLLGDKKHSIKLEQLNLLSKTRWNKKVIDFWQIGEYGALNKLNDFINHTLVNYEIGRNYPGQNNVSRLSPHLHFGEISPNRIWCDITSVKNKSVGQFCCEIAWREFAYNQLYHNPEIQHKNIDAKFDSFPWLENEEFLYRWQQGETGFPIVDAGMKELLHTGFMHGRVRMITGSFLVKNLLIHWRHGEKWFRDHLFDADMANNSIGWQWVAGCGIDAAPYFRIFNPITQGKKFDSKGLYTCTYLPALNKMPSRYLFNPFDAPSKVLKDANIELGGNYPKPIVDICFSRKRALQAFYRTKSTMVL